MIAPVVGPKTLSHRLSESPDLAGSEKLADHQGSATEHTGLQDFGVQIGSVDLGNSAVVDERRFEWWWPRRNGRSLGDDFVKGLMAESNGQLLQASVGPIPNRRLHEVDRLQASPRGRQTLGSPPQPSPSDHVRRVARTRR